MVVRTDDAYAACRRLARAHYENFPVASRLLPNAMRPHVAAIYAFARIADDFADEGAHDDRTRLDQLDDWTRRLEAAATGTVDESGGSRTTAVFTALAATIRTCALDVQPLHDLLSAFRQDVLVKRYDTWDQLLDYCRRSANPVGRLVLSVAGTRDSSTALLSDAVCTALQLTNFWQDLERDWGKGRLYVPASILDAAGARVDDLARHNLTPAWQDALREAAARTRRLFDEGRPVADAVHGRLRWELRAIWLGGVRILEGLERGECDVFRHRPSLGWRDVGPIVWKALLWKSHQP